MERLLVVDDSIPFIKDIEILLSKKYEVVTAINGRTAIELLKNEEFTAVLLDIKMPDMSGLEVMQKLRDSALSIPPIIIVSDYGEIGIVVETMKLGASDYVQKDFNLEVLTQKINNAVQKNKLQRKVDYLNQVVEEQKDKFIFRSEVMEKVNKKLNNYAKLNCNILLKGETGVGKDLIADEIFRRSMDCNDVFVSIPLSSLSENLIESELFGFEKGAFTGAEKTRTGKLESANNGTIYLPEISSLSENVQLKLLQFMQYNTISRIGQNEQKAKRINVRIIFASNENLDEKVKLGKMRSDFFYRIDSVSIDIPPLRERKDDIEPLARYFTQKHSMKIFGREINIDKRCISELENYTWPGNVRQLDHAILKAIVNMESDEELLLCSHLPREIINMTDQESGIEFSKSDYEKAKRKFRIEYFTKLLEQTNNNHTKTAELAGISRTGLDKALKELGIK
jgi:DNA-binding NtrC family response regulator